MSKATTPKNPENSGNNQEKKPDYSTRFKPGVSGNPKGKPPGTRSLTTAVREALMNIAQKKGKSYQELLVQRIIKSALEGDTMMIRILWEQLDGRPSQKIIQQVTGAIATTPMSSQKAKKLIADFNSALRNELNNTEDEEDIKH